jgi:flagellar assembly protein FliH
MGTEASTVPTTVRIIRPVSDDCLSGALGPNGRGDRVQLNLEDVGRLAERLVRDARERVASLETEARSLEASIETRRRQAEEEHAGRMAALATEAARARDTLAADVEAARLAGETRGFEEGMARGLETGHAEGHRKGYEEGCREGREAGHREAHEAETSRLRAEASALATVLDAMLREIGARKNSVLRAAREELLPLAIEIAKKVVKREVREFPEVVLGNIRKAIDLAFRRTELTVQVHPEDAALVEKHVPEIAACFSGLESISVKPSVDVGRGGCRLVSSSGVVDMRVEAQLEVIEQALFRRLEEGDPEEEAAVGTRGGATPEREVKSGEAGGAAR